LWSSFHTGQRALNCFTIVPLPRGKEAGGEEGSSSLTELNYRVNTAPFRPHYFIDRAKSGIKLRSIILSSSPLLGKPVVLTLKDFWETKSQALKTTPWCPFNCSFVEQAIRGESS
jgi:hypothetical protein